MARLAAEINALVEDELRAFNAERFYAGEKGVTPSAVVEAARILPMMADRRVVTLMRAEKMLKPRRRGKGAQARRRRTTQTPKRRPSSTCSRRTCAIRCRRPRW